MKQEIENLIQKGVIEACESVQDEFLLRYFLIEKASGGKRFILNLANEFVETTHFKMEDIRTASKLFSPENYMASLDLKDAYFLVRVDTSCRKYLRFDGDIWSLMVGHTNSGAYHLGSRQVLYVFTKIMRPVMN